MKKLLENWKLSVSVVGGALVLSSVYGTCTVDPNEEAIKEVVEEKVLDKASETKAPEEPAKTEEAKEAVKPEEPKTEAE
tara:strand:- start:305 stop:541 length:237 start_codon:yes stop_codon:yes gene_type:complete